jgi:hypothetical protein
MWESDIQPQKTQKARKGVKTTTARAQKFRPQSLGTAKGQMLGSMRDASLRFGCAPCTKLSTLPL